MTIAWPTVRWVRLADSPRTVKPFAQRCLLNTPSSAAASAMPVSTACIMMG